MVLILEYLQSLLNSGLQCTTICVHRSALSRYHRGWNGTKLGIHPKITQFLKGAFNINPPVKRLLPNWNLSIVLDVLKSHPFEPLGGLDLKMLTYKTVFLLAITSARRVSELQHLGRHPPFVRFQFHNVCLNTIPGFLAKTATPTNSGGKLFYNSFCEVCEALCVKCTIKHYIAVTQAFVGPSVDRLFVAFGGSNKGKPVSSRTIASSTTAVIILAYNLNNMPAPEVDRKSVV